MAKNTLSDLNNHLFAQLERLGEEDIDQEQLKIEVNRSKAMNSIAKNIIDSLSSKRSFKNFRAPSRSESCL